MLVRNMATVHTLNSWRSVPVDAGHKPQGKVKNEKETEARQHASTES